MKSLEHIIREIREGKCSCEKKKDSLEHAIRKVARKEYESSFAAKDSKPVDEGTDHSVYHVSWGPGLDHEVVARHGEEAVSKAKDALVAKTPKLKDPKYSDTFNKKPTVHNISKERNIQKEDVGGLVGSGTGGEEKLHAEDGKKKKDVKEAIGTLGTDKYQGNEFKSIRSSTPHIKPPGPEHGHSQAPENASRQRSIAKEKLGINRVTEAASTMFKAASAVSPIVEPLAGRAAAAALGPAAGVASMIPLAKDMAKQMAARHKEQHKTLIPPKEPTVHDETPGVSAKSSFEKMKTFALEPTKGEITDKPPAKVKPTDEPEVAAAKARAAQKAAEEKAKKTAEEQPKPPEVSVKKPEEFVPNKDAAAAAPQPKGPQGPEMPPLLPAQTRPETKTAPGTKTRPVEIPAPAKTEPVPAAEPAPKKWKEVGPPMPAETKPAPAAEPTTKSRVVQLPAIDVGTRTKVKTDAAADTKTATQTAAVPAAVTPKSAADAATTTAAEPTKPKFPGFMGAMALPDVFRAPRGLASKHPVASKARSHRRHVSEEVADKIRKKIENMPRKDAGDRKSIEYVGRSDADPKTAKEKTSRLATIKNVIDEAKKVKYEAESGKEKKFVYPNETEVVIGPNMKHNTLDVEDKKPPKDYENK